MVIKKVNQVLKTKIDDEKTKSVTRQILIGEDDGSDNIIMRLFTLGPKGYSPLHTHDFEHLVKVEKGRGIAVLEKGEQEITEGDLVYVKPNELHQFRNDSDEEFQFICVIPNKK
ncbi:MAG: cupin domain-containing protein [bacterium]|nr:cupin domain-containing protein [bacterium]